MVADPTRLSFDAWAVISGRLTSRTAKEREALWDQVGLDKEAWDAIDEAHTNAMVDAMIAGDASLMERYAVVSAREARAPGTSRNESADVTLALPTESGATPALPFASAPIAGADIAPRTLGPASCSGETASIEGPGVDSPLPFEPPPTVGLTVQEYATFRAEIAVHPERTEEVSRRYGISDATARRDLDEAWRKRFATDRALQQQFLKLSSAGRDALLANKRR